MFRFRTIAAALAAVLLPATANAALVTVRDNPSNGDSVFAVNSGGDELGRTFDVTFNGDTFRAGGGVFGLQYGSDADGWTDFYTFCFELDENLDLPFAYEWMSGGDYFADADVRNAIGIIFGNFMNESYSFMNSTYAAATQTIIWELMIDGYAGFDLSSGMFLLLTQDVLDVANSLWGLISGGTLQAIDFDMLVANGNQDLVVPPAEVPVPGALPLLITGIAGMRLAARRKKLQTA